MAARPRLALATFSGLPDLYEDDRPVLAPLAAAGVHVDSPVWDDPAGDWSAYDLVGVRSTWDYTLRRDEFLAWAGSVPRLANPADVLAWNTDKRYLAELADAGVPVVPTEFVAPGEDYDLPLYEHVVKPTVSAGARDTRRFAAGEDSSEHAEALLASGRHVMVQPYQAAVDEAGETAVLSFLGVHSHAARKAAVLTPGLDDPDDVEITPRVASAAELAVARAALAAVPWSEPLLYARVDLVPGPDGAPVVMELELTEPCLFLRQSVGAADRVAAAIRTSL
jgi:hypothetical protein